MSSKRIEATHQRDGLPRFPFGWGTSFTLGLITLILGVIVTIRPTRSLTVIAVLLGVAMIASGVFHIVRAIGGREHERVWRGISGVLFIVAGLALIRHLHLSLALIGIFIGATWVIQGISTLMESLGRDHASGEHGRGRGETGWSVFFGVLSLIAGIVVISAPIASVAALTIFMGVWFIVMGFMEMMGALLARRAGSEPGDGQVNVPGPRASEAGTGEAEAREARAGEAGGREAGTGTGTGTGSPGPAGRNAPR
jgi:uncharacterized membrane protein HdeD (DUF308 family)